VRGMISTSLLRSLALIALAVICLAAAPASPIPLRTTETERLPHFDTSGTLPSQREFERLAMTDAIAALKASITRAGREVRGYRAMFLKQERIGGKLHDPEEIAVAFREEPFGVAMHWKKGARTMAEATLFVRDEHGNNMLAWLRLIGTIGTFSPRDGIARKAARYGIEDFGIVLGSQRTLKSWSAVGDRGELDVEYLGLQPVPELDGKPCFALRRTCRTDTIDPFLLSEPPVAVADKNRPDAFRTVTIYFDPETWLQVGSRQLRADGELIGAYFFKDLVLNPTFAPDEFKAEGLKK